MPALNPWTLLGIAVALALAGAGGFRAGVDHEQAKAARAQAALQQDADIKQGIIDTLALAVRAQSREADNHALRLTQEIRNAKDRLAVCAGSGNARLSGEFVRLYDLALQTPGAYRPEPAGEARGAADPGDVLELEAENGRRWKKCRDRYTALIEAVQ